MIYTGEMQKLYVAFSVRNLFIPCYKAVDKVIVDGKEIEFYFENGIIKSDAMQI